LFSEKNIRGIDVIDIVLQKYKVIKISILIIYEDIHAPLFLENPFFNNLANITVLDYIYSYGRCY
jgi:hypothetical protein